MRLSRPRFTLRWLMVAVAVLGASLGLWRRSVEFRERADELTHVLIPHRLMPDRLPGIITPVIQRARDEKARRNAIWYPWARDMVAKYERAARYPWLPVGSDPPEPE
jgi:hypothetical protein